MQNTLTGASSWRFFTFRNLVWIFIAMIVVRAGLFWSILPERIARGDNDDFLRIVMVRDWLAGQGWFDMQQYRLLPPEGVSIHWSRYIDAGIAGLIGIGSIFLPGPMAERFAVLAWPTLLMIVLLLVNGVATRRISGLLAATGSMLAVACWTKTGGFEFAPGRVDHHNVQIICATIVAFSLVWPVRSERERLVAAVCGGFAAAFSFAVGLEMLPVVLLVWAMAGLRFAFGREGAGRWLVTFALMVSLASPLLMAGQVPVEDWATRYCDVLAPPLLSLIAVGLVVSLVPVLAGRWIRHPMGRIGLMAGLFAGGIALAWPMLGPCSAGPYSNMPAEARAIITERIGEAQPALTVLLESGASFDFLLLYLVVVLVVATLLALRARRRLGADERAALVLMLLIGWMGLLASLGQIRASTLAAPAVPFLTGFVLRELLRDGREGVKRMPVLAALLGVALMGAPVEVMAPMRSLFAPTAQSKDPTTMSGSSVSASLRCRDADAMARLDALPPSLIASTTELGVPLLYYTKHSATTAPYHRSGAAFWNGEDPFRTGADMLRMLRQSGADYVLLCRTQNYAASKMDFAEGLLDGIYPAWLEPVPLPADDGTTGLMVLRVLKPLPAEPK